MNIIKGLTNSWLGAARALLGALPVSHSNKVVMVFQPRHVPEAVMEPPKMWTRPRTRPLRNDPNAIIRAARRRERRSITRARNIVRGWIGTYKPAPESIRHLATP